MGVVSRALFKIGISRNWLEEMTEETKAEGTVAKERRGWGKGEQGRNEYQTQKGKTKGKKGR